jgi:ankyrin repeat protein
MGLTPLVAAITEGNQKMVELLLKGGADPNTRDEHEGAPLILAVSEKRCEVRRGIVHVLLESGADPNVTDFDGRPPLFTAVACEDSSLVQMLLDKGADLNATDNEGGTPWTWAMERGFIDIINLYGKGAQHKRLLRREWHDRERYGVVPYSPVCIGGNAGSSRQAAAQYVGRLRCPCGKPVRIIGNRFAFPEASKEGRSEVKKLLDKGNEFFSIWKWARDHYPASVVGEYDVTCLCGQHRVAIYMTLSLSTEHQRPINLSGWSLAGLSIDIPTAGKMKIPELYEAVLRGDSGDVLSLIAEKPDCVTEQDDIGRTALHVAAANGDMKIVEALLAKGADASILDKFGCSPFLDAVLWNQVETAKLLLNCDIDVNVQCDSGVTPLIAAVLKGRQDIGELVLNLGANPDVIDRCGRTALSIAAEEGHEDLVEMLVNKGADLNMKDGRERTPLLIAIECANDTMLEMLLRAGCDANARDTEDVTPLIRATEVGRERPVESLVLHNADLSATAKKRLDRTALHIAASKGRLDVAKVLIEAGADAKVKDKDGRTPRQLAKENGHRNVAKLIRKHEGPWCKFWS